jgi:acyl carrier protein
MKEHGMSDVWQKMKEVISDKFFEIGNLLITPQTRLGDIPYWDSMSAVNLQILLHETFHVELPLELFHDNTTFNEMITLVEQPEQIPDAVRRFRERS